MSDPPAVHVRRPDDPQHRAYCGQAGESVSLAFWHLHVVPHRADCCRALYQRLCRDCDKLIPWTLDGEPRAVIPPCSPP